jgi:hypothetical protein
MTEYGFALMFDEDATALEVYEKLDESYCAFVAWTEQEDPGSPLLRADRHWALVASAKEIRPRERTQKLWWAWYVCVEDVVTLPEPHAERSTLAG